MKVLLPVSTALRIAFWLVALALVAGFVAAGRHEAGPVTQPTDSRATAHVVDAGHRGEVNPSWRPI